MHSCLPDSMIAYYGYIQISFAMLTPTIAITVALIAFFQYRLAKQKFRFDLMQKRYLIFKDTQDIIECVLSRDFSRNLTYQHITTEAHFLFPNEIESFLEEIESKCSKLKKLIENPKKSTEENNELWEIQKWLGNCHQALKNKFDPYLSFSDWN